MGIKTMNHGHPVCSSSLKTNRMRKIRIMNQVQRARWWKAIMPTQISSENISPALLFRFVLFWGVEFSKDVFGLWLLHSRVRCFSWLQVIKEGRIDTPLTLHWLLTWCHHWKCCAQEVCKERWPYTLWNRTMSQIQVGRQTIHQLCHLPSPDRHFHLYKGKETC